MKADNRVPARHLSETPMILLHGYLVMVEIAFVTLGTLDVVRPRERASILRGDATA